MLGPWLWDVQGSRPLGGGVTQHVEADPTRGPVVPRRQLAPVAALLAIPGAAIEGKNGGATDTRLGPRRGPASELRRLKSAPSPLRSAAYDHDLAQFRAVSAMIVTARIGEPRSKRFGRRPTLRADRVCRMLHRAVTGASRTEPPDGCPPADLPQSSSTGTYPKLRL